MGIGLAAERFAHEFDRCVAALSANLKKLEAIRPYDPNVKALRVIFDTLKSEVTLMGAARYVRKPPEPVEVNVSDVIEMVLLAHAKEFEDYSIKVEKDFGEGFKIKVSVAALSQVFDNVIANAIYWLSGKSEVNERNLHVQINKDEQSVIISNNGPKIQPHIKRSIFAGRPFVSSKPSGRGLGMFITQKILERNNGSIELLDENDPRNKFGGAAFRISFE